jgi:uncharacterized membrane protein
MKTNRLEAFSDGVLAIIITIMVLEFKVPEGDKFEDIQPLIPIFLTYLFSFIYLGIYWNNHHHLMHITQKVNGNVLWANLHLLFWLSILPFATGWMGENHFGKHPVAFYGFVLLMNAIAWKILTYFIIKNEGENSKLKQVYQNDTKGSFSVIIYLIGLILSFFYPKISLILYAIVAIMWFIPDRRIEKTVH